MHDAAGHDRSYCINRASGNAKARGCEEVGILESHLQRFHLETEGSGGGGKRVAALSMKAIIYHAQAMEASNVAA